MYIMIYLIINNLVAFFWETYIDHGLKKQHFTDQQVTNVAIVVPEEWYA